MDNNTAINDVVIDFLVRNQWQIFIYSILGLLAILFVRRLRAHRVRHIDYSTDAPVDRANEMISMMTYHMSVRRLPRLGLLVAVATIVPLTVYFVPVISDFLADIRPFPSTAMLKFPTVVESEQSDRNKKERWCRKVGGKLENRRKLPIVKPTERRSAAAERSLRHGPSYSIDVPRSIFR